MALVSGRWRRGLPFLIPLILLLPLLLSVTDLHRKVQLEGREVRNNPQKPHFLVLGTAAGLGRPDRIQCDGTGSLNRTHPFRSGKYSTSNGHISIVTVFTIYNNTHSSGSVQATRVTVGNVSYDKTSRAMAILDAFIGFIQVFMPNSNVIILSDPTSTFSVKGNSIDVMSIPGDYSRMRLMLQRIRSYIKFLQTKLAEHSQNPQHLNHYIFTDSDIAIVDDLGDIFEEYPHFHVALTFRNNLKQPINSGFIAVRGTGEGLHKAIIFFQSVLDIYVSRFMEASGMLGDQLALAWVVKSQKQFDLRKFAKPTIFLEEIGGVKVLFLPCLVYNWTPPEGAGQFHGMPLNVKVVHFKGSRKRLMLEAWNLFNSSGSSLIGTLRFPALIMKYSRAIFSQSSLFSAVTASSGGTKTRAKKSKSPLDPRDPVQFREGWKFVTSWGAVRQPHT